MPPSPLDLYLSKWIGKLPGVVVTPKFGHVNFTLRKKVFAFTRPGSLVVKLPAEKAQERVQKKKAVFLVMGQKKMKEWIVIHKEKPADFKKELGLLKESMAYVQVKK